jgi:hypothetical protein
MSCIKATAKRPASPWTSRLAGPAVGTGVGALLAAGYGALVACTHLVVIGRLDRAGAFAVGATVASVVWALLGEEPIGPQPMTTPRAGLNLSAVFPYQRGKHDEHPAG